MTVTKKVRALRGVLLAASLLTAAAGGIAGPAGASAHGRASRRSAAGGSSRGSCAAHRAAGTVTFVSPFGYDASAGILDVFAAQHLGYFADLCLRVDIVASSPDPYALVSSGMATITGEGSAADTLVAVADGSHFVGVATFGDTSDYALLTQPGITRLTQLRGKIVAYHTVMPVVLSEMLAKAGVNPATLHEVNDTSYDPDLLTEGRFAALQAYQSNEPITLREQHKAFREYTPGQFGIPGTFNVQVVNSAFLARHPSAVAAFLRADLHAFGYCSAHAAACIEMERRAASASGVTYNVAHNLAEWRFEDALALHHTLHGRGVGVETAAEWTPEQAALRRSHLLSSVPSLASAEDTTLVASLYHGRSLIWPGP
ncbi:MAG: ABC transporter substrate-binding protein [Acidimicrobiales bacterium]